MFNNNNKYYNKYINSLPIKLFKSKNKQNIINPPIFKYNPPINKQIEKNVSNIPFDFDNVIIIKNDVNMPNVVINEIPFILVNNNHINNDINNDFKSNHLNFNLNENVGLNNDFINNDFINNDFEIKYVESLTDKFKFKLNMAYNEYDYVSIIKNKQINKIIHVYQEKYANNINVSGLGDFIRSCFFIIQFCKKHDFNLDIIVNHPIAYFLKNSCDEYALNSLPNSNSIVTLKKHNFVNCIFDNNNYIKEFLLIKYRINTFCDYLSNQPVINGAVTSYNIFLPYNNVSLQECNQVRLLLEPSNEINDFVEESLIQLSLVKKHYIVIHIRTGDFYLKDSNTNINLRYYNIIKNEILNIIFKNNNTDFLIISDNNEIKKLLVNISPFIKILINEITHLGEGIKLERNKVKNTLLDFYLMSVSSFIYAFTCYNHGSGFSYWCSKIYNIPYLCKLVK